MLSQHATLIIKWYTCHQADHCNACSNFSYSTGLVYSRWWVCYTDHNLFTLNMILCFGWHISVFSSVKHPISLVWMYITAIQEKTFCFLSINDLQQSISNFQFFPVPAMSNRCFRCCGMDEGCFNAPYRNAIIECLSHVTTFRNTVFLKENMISTGSVQENILKGYSTQNWKFCYYLLILKLLQTCMSFFLLLNTKEDVLKNDLNQTVVWHHWLPSRKKKILWKSMEFGSNRSSKYLRLCSAEERNSYRFATTWGWVNDDRIFIFGWSIPLSIQRL